MASSRRTGARARPRAAARRSAPSSSSSAVLIGSLVLGAAVLLLVFAMAQGGQDTSAEERRPAAAPPAGSPAGPALAEPVAARAGSTPGRPAPVIPDEVFARGDELYREAAGLWNDGQDARRAGRTADYQAALLASWKVFGELYDTLGPYTDWFEEADLEGWAMPASYVTLQGRLEVWDVLRAKVRKLKPMTPR